MTPLPARDNLLGEVSVASRAVIHFECRAPAHLALPSRRGSGGLTVHDRAWAYCDGDGADDALEWFASGGVPIDLLIRWSRPVTASVGRGGARQPTATQTAATIEKIPPPSRKRSR